MRHDTTLPDKSSHLTRTESKGDQGHLPLSCVPAEGAESSTSLLVPGTRAGNTTESPHNPETRLLTWIECAQDKRSWAEVKEEEEEEVFSHRPFYLLFASARLF